MVGTMPASMGNSPLSSSRAAARREERISRYPLIGGASRRARASVAASSGRKRARGGARSQRTPRQTSVDYGKNTSGRRGRPPSACVARNRAGPRRGAWEDPSCPLDLSSAKSPFKIESPNFKVLACCPGAFEIHWYKAFWPGGMPVVLLFIMSAIVPFNEAAILQRH